MKSISVEHLHREPGSGLQTWKLTQIIFFFVKVITVGRKPIQKPATSCSLQRNSGPPRLFKRSDTHVTYLNRHHRLEGGGRVGCKREEVYPWIQFWNCWNVFTAKKIVKRIELVKHFDTIFIAIVERFSVLTSVWTV